MANSAFIDFNGFTGVVRGMEFTYSRGVTPSVGTLYINPQDNLDFGVGTLKFGDGFNQMQFTNCAVASAHIRPHWDSKWPTMAVKFQDRRWKWKRLRGITGEYNKRVPTSIGYFLTARDLMTRCLDAMGETGYDVSGAPTGVYPYVKWDKLNPSLALAELCDYCACEVVLNPLSDKVEIWQNGYGRNSPTGLTDLQPKWRFTARANVPSVIEVHGGDSLFQYRLLLKAIGRQSNLTQGPLGLVDYLIGLTPSGEGFNFPSVTSTVNSELALATVWKQYRVVGQEGGSLNIPGLNVPISTPLQYKLKPYIAYNTYDYLTGTYQLLPYYIEGNFWPYSDLPVNTSNTVYDGPSTLDTDRQIVEFPHPLVAVDGSGFITEPTLYLQTAYGVVDQQGYPVHLVRLGNLGGSGGTLVLNRPEVFASYSPSGSTEAGAVNELDAYVQLFTQKYANQQASEMHYGGILTGPLDGIVSQCRWEIHPSKGPTTYVYENFEGDIFTVGRDERRRREWTRKMRGDN